MPNVPDTPEVKPNFWLSVLFAVFNPVKKGTTCLFKKSPPLNLESDIINEIVLRYKNKIKENPGSKEIIQTTVFSMLTLFDNMWVGKYCPTNMEISFIDYNCKKKLSWHDEFKAKINEMSIYN